MPKFVVIVESSEEEKEILLQLLNKQLEGIKVKVKHVITFPKIQLVITNKGSKENA